MCQENKKVAFLREAQRRRGHPTSLTKQERIIIGYFLKRALAGILCTSAGTDIGLVVVLMPSLGYNKTLTLSGLLS